MWMSKRVKVAMYERALVYRERNFDRVLGPGKYWLWGREIDVQVYDVSKPELALPRSDVLVAEARAQLEPFVQIVELGDREVGRVQERPPGRRAGAGVAPVVLARSGGGARRRARPVQ